MASVGFCKFNFFERRLRRLFSRYSTIVAEYPWYFIIIPAVIACALSAGNFFKRDIKDAFYLYTPSNGRALYEKRIIEEKWPPVDGTYAPSRSVSPKGECVVVVSSKDNGNILRSQLARALVQLNQFVIDDISVTMSGRRYGYRDLCMKFLNSCHNNPQIFFVNQLFESDDASSYGELTYPSVKYQNQNYYIGNSLGGVTLDPATKLVAEAKAWLLLYQIKYSTPEQERIGKLWELEFQRRLLAYKDPFLKVTFFHSLTLEIELARNADHLKPRFVICFIVLILFAIFSTFCFVWHDNIPYVDWIRSKPTTAIVGVVGAAMGIFASIGFLAISGYEHSDLIQVMPFLVLAVRLDNTFLMIAALHSVDRNMPIKDRISVASSEAAVSITITVLTDILSFGCGYFTAFPAVRMFCIYTTLAIAVTFLFQLTFVLAFLVLAARLESRNAHSIIPFLKTVPVDELGKVSLWKRMFCAGTCKCEKEPNDKKEMHMNEIVRTYYAPFLMNKYTKIATLLLFVSYMATSIYGCCLLRQGLEPAKLLVDDSYAIDYYKSLENYFWNYGVQVQVVFNDVGDLSDPLNRREIYEIVRKFAFSKRAIGLEGVDFWLLGFENFLQQKQKGELGPIPDENLLSFSRKVRYFLSLAEYARYRNDISWKVDPVTGAETVDSFRLLVGIRNFSFAMDQIVVVDNFRTIADSYPKFNITTFHVMWLFVDQYEQILPNTLQEIYSGVSCMIAIALVFIPSPICSLWVALSVVSIDVGVVGYMTLWGLNMDAVSMIAIIMSIGFSVDFSAHIAYSFAASESSDAVEKTREALATTAWPILQGGAATVMGVIVLADLNSYMVAAFFKTVFLVVVLGLLHGLVFLPVVLSLFSCKFRGGAKVKINERTVKDISSPVVYSKNVNLVAIAALSSASGRKVPSGQRVHPAEIHSISKVTKMKECRTGIEEHSNSETSSHSSSVVPEDP